MIGNKSMELKSTVVVITGASSGIGRATALELAQKRASLVLVARREEALHGLAEECERLGGRALAVPTDVSIEGHVYGVVQ
jgi:NADP-dependent 3-hydroxy acid dehydrogenase YdfG